MILRLLIVDDDTSLSHHLKTFFERQKYKVETAEDGPGAVTKTQDFHPHLMFLDIGLPGMSGIEVLKEVKQKDPSVRVIMITGQTEDELMRQARILGADDYVTKPFTLEYLSGEVMNKLHKQLFHELRSTSQDLAIEREKMELVFDHMAEGVILFDSNGLIFMANPVAKSLLGLPVEVNSLTAEKVFETFACEPKDRLAHLENEKGEPFDLLRMEPRQFSLEARISSIFSPKKDRFGYLMLFRDVTYERKADNAMHHFISLISHKLRTPLVTIRAYPKLLLTETGAGALTDFQKNAMETIHKQCLVMEDMVNQLIAFSSLDPDQLLCQPMSLAELVTEAIKHMPDDLKDKAPLVKKDAALERCTIQADPTLMQHAFRNVIENAFKFGATALEVSGVADNGHVTIRFKDNGPGIPTEDIEHVFDRFYQVEKTFCGQVPGAGLGLTMVKQTVEAHGGKVWAESVFGKGATLVMQLPSVAPPHGQPH
jgi:two-component system sensor histidine kinase VicK